ncbi:MAG TPA: cyclic nucleotide-binding domain-containing protein [Solirubrobacteraceae bacterium]|nr:cyclic nucleotide-binding domain-containing protein [Solirubrobacteraceae bacterium]
MDENRLQELPLFSGLSKRERKRLAPLVEEVDVKDGRELAHEGDLAFELFVIVEGTASVRHDGEHIAGLGPGDFFGEIALLDDERRRTSTVIATSPMRLAVMQGHDVRVVEREFPAVASQIRAAINSRLASDERR